MLEHTLTVEEYILSSPGTYCKEEVVIERTVFSLGQEKLTTVK